MEGVGDVHGGEHQLRLLQLCRVESVASAEDDDPRTGSKTGDEDESLVA